MTIEAGSELRPAGEAAAGDFDAEQKRYLEGFAAGAQIARATKTNTGAGTGRRLRPPSRSARRRRR